MMTQKLHVYVPDELDAKLRALAEDRGQTLSTLVTRLLQSALAKVKEPAR